MQSFVHLHVHSQYSILDGQASISRIVDKAIEDGMPGVAITDHGNMFGIKEFFNYVSKKNGKIEGLIKDLKKELDKLKENGASADEINLKSDEIQKTRKKLFKGIIGCEVYVARNGRHVKQGRENLSGNHLILLAKNKTGYHNLVKLVSIGWVEGFYGRPRIDKEILEKYKEGLIVSSACLGGEIPRLIRDGKIDEAEKMVLWYKNIFG
ncbi:MAG: PHP domain-containing protein, partial [Bacteroidales bacterium]